MAGYAGTKTNSVNGGNGGPGGFNRAIRRAGKSAGCGAALSLRVCRPAQFPAAPRSVQEDPGAPDVPLQLRSPGRNAGRTPGHRHRRSQPVDDDRRDQPAAEQARHHQSFHAGADHARSSRKPNSPNACWKKPAKALPWMWSRGRGGATRSISIDRLTAQGDDSPIIRLVDTTIFTALQRRASDIHIETRDDSVCIKFRIDGVLTQAMPPIGKEHHSTIISRIKVMSELDISERRVPQDGRFRVKYGNPGTPHRFPRLHHAFDSWRRRRTARSRQRIDEREVPEARARCGGFRRRRSAEIPPLYRRALRHGAGYRTHGQRQNHDPVRGGQRDQDR